MSWPEAISPIEALIGSLLCFASGFLFGSDWRKKHPIEKTKLDRRMRGNGRRSNGEPFKKIKEFLSQTNNGAGTTITTISKETNLPRSTVRTVLLRNRETFEEPTKGVWRNQP